MTIEKLVNKIKDELAEAKSFYLDDTSKQEGYIDALKFVLSLAQQKEIKQ